MKKSITVNVGIYSTAYQLIQHRNGDITVIAPYVKWTNNNGVLAFEKIRFNADIEGQDIVKVKEFFEQDTLVNDQFETLEDYLY